jgi:hypothetical protein
VNAEERTSDSVGMAAAASLPLRQADLEAAITRLTRALATADDESIPELVAERASLRRELEQLRQVDAGVVRLEDERKRRR